jgi:centromere protein V
MSPGASAPLVTHRGGCHCGRVRFEVDAPARVVAHACNCSICSMTGFLHLIVPASRFRLLSGRDELATYTFNTATAQHFFCRTCGIKSFYVPRSNPDGYSVNVNCLDRSTISDVDVQPFDGRNWDRAADSLRSLSHA